MRRCAPVLAFLVVAFAAPTSVRAVSVELGVIFPSAVDYPAPIPVGGGIGWGTFIVANLGSQDLIPSALTFTVQLLSTTAVGPLNILTQNQYDPGFVLHPGEAAGHVGSAGGGP